MKYIIITIMWAGFAFIHSFFISLRVSNWAVKAMGHYYAFYRLAYNILSLVLFAVFYSFTKQLDTQLIIKWMQPWTILQQILLLISGAIMILAFLSYDTFEFIGVRQLMNIHDKQDSVCSKTITKKGLLGIVRHPMYLATIVFMWSLNSTRSDILVHFILTAYILIGIRLEENKLVKQFGSEYIEYQKEVPALIPSTKKLFRLNE